MGIFSQKSAKQFLITKIKKPKYKYKDALKTKIFKNIILQTQNPIKDYKVIKVNIKTISNKY